MKVSLEVAVVAHEKGFYFQAPCFCGDAENDGECNRCRVLQEQCENFTAYRPSQTEVQKVLRNINIHAASEAIPQPECVKFIGHILYVGNNVMISENTKFIRDSYEEALDDALEYGLEMIEVIDTMEEEGEYDDDDDSDDEDYE